MPARRVPGPDKRDMEDGEMADVRVQGLAVD
jgi:hypothetical protein